MIYYSGKLYIFWNEDESDTINDEKLNIWFPNSEKHELSYNNINDILYENDVINSSIKKWKKDIKKKWKKSI